MSPISGRASRRLPPPSSRPAGLEASKFGYANLRIARGADPNKWSLEEQHTPEYIAFQEALYTDPNPTRRNRVLPPTSPANSG
jgi:hypothetical protein